MIETAAAAIARLRPELAVEAELCLGRAEAVAFLARLDRWFADIHVPVTALYGADVVERLVRLALCAAAERPVAMRETDRRREIDPGWFQHPSMIGYVAYTDRFAGTLDAVAGRLDHLTELGVSYLHLMPLLQPRDGENDGGYAVAADARQPRLGRDRAVNAPPAPFVPEQHHFRPGYALVVVGFGDPAAHAAAAARLRDIGAAPLFEFVTPMPYAQVQSFQDEAAPWGTCFYDSSAFLRDLTDDAIATITARVPERNPPQSQVLLYTVDGAYNDVGEDDTAFGGPRDARFVVFAVGLCAAATEVPAARAWVRSLIDPLRLDPRRPASTSGYVNALGPDEMDGMRQVYGAAKHDRLARIKAVYDPSNAFCHNANIRPARRL